MLRSWRTLHTALAGFCTLASGPVLAQQTAVQPLFANPPSLLDSAPPHRFAPMTAVALRASPKAQAHAGVEHYFDLYVDYVNATIKDPTNNWEQPVKLRAYRDLNGGKAGAPFVAPMVRATPGDTIRITLHNKLPADSSCAAPTGPDAAHCYNDTNMHSHGLWVSPSGNSDNVLLSINPGVDFQYEYNIPADHPAGTFWFHPHQHGSTAVQVGSGMAGALIINGNRKPTVLDNGDLDTLLYSGATPFPEKVMLFQQVPYACFSADMKTFTWDCKKDQTGVVESIKQFDPGTWATSKRWTSINGLVLPTIPVAQSGEVERWRLIHAGVRETIQVQFVKKVVSTKPAALTAGLIRTSEEATIQTACNGPSVPYQVVAADGLTLDRTFTSTAVTLQPGYRYDLLVIFPEPGEYCMVQPAVGASDNASATDSPATLLGFVTVGGTKKVARQDLTQTLVNILVASAKANMNADVRESIISGLTHKVDTKAGPQLVPLLSRFVPHPTVTEDEIKTSGMPTQDLVFFIRAFKDEPKTGFEVGNSFDVVLDNNHWVPKGAAEYDPKEVARSLILGKAQEWELRSYSVSHPFHIHVNPFQIVKILDPDGKDVSLPKDPSETSTEDDQFAGLSGAWKDTIWVKTLLQPGDLKKVPEGYYKIVVRTRYERYIGEFVLHCHILDHEDQGMMQNVQISLPDGMGGMAHGHH